MSTSFRILHFNDVYRVTPQKTPQGKISVTQFAHLLANLSSGSREKPLVLFSGDAFSPSVESTVTRGSHMVPVLNAFGLDVALTGNHDFDFGFPHLTKLVKDSSYPWILSNIIDTETGGVPETLKEFVVIERFGIKIGVIGLVEKEWIETVSSWPPNFKHQDMVEVGIRLSEKLRDVNGQWGCDIVIALTHCRIPNDIILARALAARPSSSNDVSMSHGVDMILGGHDHLYFVSKGCHEWEGHQPDGTIPLGTEKDDGVLVVKSGTDFRDLSEITLEIENGPPGAVRRKMIKRVTGIRHSVTPTSASSKQMEALLEKLLSSVSSKLGSPLCRIREPFNVRSEVIRTKESASANWFADVILHCYDSALCLQGFGGADGVLICAGTLRGDSVYGPGVLTLGDILEILPFEDPVVVVELTGKAIWDALENALRTWPAQEGRFPVVSAFRVTWDSRRPPGQRVLDISVERPVNGNGNGSLSSLSASRSSPPSTPSSRSSSPSTTSSTSELILEKIDRDSTKTYVVVTRDYMAEGHDGFEALKGSRYLIDEEHGTLMSSLVRRYILGSQYIHTMQQRASDSSPGMNGKEHLHPETRGLLSRARAHWRSARKRVMSPSRKRTSKVAGKDAHKIVGREHMQCVDVFDGSSARAGVGGPEAGMEPIRDAEDLIEIHPLVDGRLRDVGRR